MRAVVVERFVDPSELSVGHAPDPEVGPGMIGVEVRAAGCNWFDTLIVQGKYQVKPPLPFVPGAEIAGVVREVGAGVIGFAVGDRVLATLPYGGFAERVAVPSAAAVRMPDAMSFEQGAALPIVYPTAYASLVWRAGLCAGEWLLVTAAAGGVGLASIEIGKALGAKVVALAGGEDKLAIARQVGADVAIDYRDADWVERVRAATAGRGVDVVVENVGGEVFEGAMKSLAWAGRLVVCGFVSGKIPEVKANRILLKNISLVGIHWGAYAMNDPDRFRGVYEPIFALFREGKIAPHVFATYPLDRIGEALGALGSRKTWGKVVLLP
jgi:NADPH2:quinone reductase